ncbi:MAG: site-2 protease family protein [Acidobacteria bacterium]|nr:site-2 protease family protein [Acidobacteriota bacterium]
MQFRQFQVARIFGIPVIIDYSWIPVALLHVWLLSQFWLPARIRPAWPIWLNLILGLAISGLFFGSVLAHELAHSLIARLEGIRIHDIQLHIFGGWARLVGEPRTAMAEFRVAIAGPASSFILSLLFAAGLVSIQLIGSRNLGAIGIIETCYYLMWANMLLAMFNLLPGLPLDGGRALRAILWHRRKDILSATRTAKRMGVGIAYMIISYGIFLIGFGLYRGTLWQDFMMAVWFFVIGVFLKNAAESDYRHREQQHAHEQEIRKNVEGWRVAGTVGSVMQSPVITVLPELKVSEFIDTVLAEHRLTHYPVARDGRLHGVLSLERLRRVPREDWERKVIEDVMEPISETYFISVRASIDHAERKLKSNPLGFLAVIDGDGFLVGALSAADIELAV